MGSNMSSRLKVLMLALGFAASGLASQATLMLGVNGDWPSTDPKADYPGIVIGTQTGSTSTETAIAALINSLAATSFVKEDIHKTDKSLITKSATGNFTIPGGWDYAA